MCVYIIFKVDLASLHSQTFKAKLVRQNSIHQVVGVTIQVVCHMRLLAAVLHCRFVTKEVEHSKTPNWYRSP